MSKSGAPARWLGSRRRAIATSVSSGDPPPVDGTWPVGPRLRPVSRLLKPGRLAVGMQLPIQSQSTIYAQPWEASSGPAELEQIVRAADRSGFDYVAVCDHIAIPDAQVESMNPIWYDTVATLSWIAGFTDAVHLLSHVYVPAYRHPAAVVKAWSTLDALSGGRAILGVGAGHVAGEFELLGLDPATAGPTHRRRAPRHQHGLPHGPARRRHHRTPPRPGDRTSDLDRGLVAGGPAAGGGVRRRLVAPGHCVPRHARRGRDDPPGAGADPRSSPGHRRGDHHVLSPRHRRRARVRGSGAHVRGAGREAGHRARPPRRPRRHPAPGPVRGSVRAPSTPSRSSASAPRSSRCSPPSDPSPSTARSQGRSAAQVIDLHPRRGETASHLHSQGKIRPPAARSSSKKR